MKNLITSVFIIASWVTAQGQTIDSTKCGYVVNIMPIKAKFTDSLKSQYLKAVIVGDDMVNSGTFYYQLLDSNCTCTIDGNVIIDGEAYQGWTGSSEEAYLFIANHIGVAIKND